MGAALNGRPAGGQPEEAAVCVRCGLCLQACPSASVVPGEESTPRGRLQLLELADGEGRPGLERLLDAAFGSCLGCGGCSAVCPNGVDPAGLFDAARERFALPLVKRAALAVLDAPISRQQGLMRAGRSLLPLLGRPIPDGSGLSIRLPGLAGLCLPALSPDAFDRVTETGPSGSALLFPGCVGRHLLAGSSIRMERLVRAAGLSPAFDQGLECCGLAAWAAGARDRTGERMRANLEAFERSGASRVVTQCASCAHMLKRVYPAAAARFGLDPGMVGRFAAAVTTLSGLLAETGCTVRLAGGAAGSEIRFHHPCHLKHDPDFQPHPARLLRRVASEAFADGEVDRLCCGHGGLFNLAHPDESRTIGDRRLARLPESAGRVIVTECSGCLLQLFDRAVAHPSTRVVWLADALEPE